MASPASNKPSSSPQIPNRPNPKPRNSEATDPLRRTFGGNPFPAISKVNIPSDSRRNSFGRENSRLEFSDKENETKASSTPKGSKNFMSPTISAVSKINASPRKRVLSDRNELSRSSEVRGLILEDTKNHNQFKSCVSFSDVIQVIGIDENKQFDESHDMTITDFDENEIYESKGIAYSDPRFKISPSPSVPYTSPEFVAFEVDPLLPPYDPKNNYLSPRPQFLHYRPNPRVEQRFDECKQLEGLFSESFSSDTELCVEETEKCEEQEKESGADAVVEEEVEDAEQLEVESDEGIEETSQVLKQSGFRKFKFLGWLLALALGCMLVSATFSSPRFSFSEFHILEEVKEFSKANNLEQLSEKLWTLTASSVVYIDKLISRLGGEEEFGPLQFNNLTDILEDYTVFQPTSVEISEDPLQGENNLVDASVSGGEESSDVVSQTKKGDTETDNVYEEESGGEDNSDVVSETKDGDAETDNVIEEESKGEENSDVVCETKDGDAETDNVFEEESGGEENSDVVCETDNVFDEQSEIKLGTDIELSDSKGNSEAVFENVIELNTEEQGESEVFSEVKNDASGIESQEKLETGDNNIYQEELEEVHSEATNINQHDELEAGYGETEAETSDDPNKTGNDITKEMMIIFSSILLVLLSSVSFLLTKKAKPVALSAPEHAPEKTEKLNLGRVTVDNLKIDKLSSLNLEDEVNDRISSSFDEKSSFSSSEYIKEPKGNQSSSKLRRESMASSASEYSADSFSYGSFTTYEKIPIKSGDEEIITPVRRSSRLRNHHHSSSGL